MKTIELCCCLVILTALSTSGVVIRCDYEINSLGSVGIAYRCSGTVISAENPTVVTEISGTHMEGKTNADVIGLNIFNDQILSKIPKGIEKFFPNLQGFMWWRGNISAIDKSVFEPFPHLLMIYLAYNKLASLDDDLFQHTRMVREVHFNDNLLQHVGFDLLTGLTMRFADFQRNLCINMMAGTSEAIQELRLQLPIACPPLAITTTTTTTTAPTTTTTPTQPPILSDCYAITHLFNAENGEYMKSYCIFDIRPSGYEQAEATCRDHNMNLFVIENSSMQSAFFKATTNDLERYGNIGVLWINGRKESNDEWFTFNPNRAPLYDGVEWVKTGTVDGRVSGDCLMYLSEHGHYQAMGGDCNRTHWCTCEFRWQ